LKSEHFVLILRQLDTNPAATQRQLAEGAGLSLGLVNGIIKESLSLGYLEQNSERKLLLTEAGRKYLDEFKVKNAIILAAGFGSRCIPLTYETPKGLLSVCGKPMIERQIEQLNEKGITDIIIVVGYMKEHFDYLIDKYGVKLVYNAEYAVKNNIASLYCAISSLDNTYVLNSDNRMEENIFNTYEPHSWFSCIYIDGPTNEWCVTNSQKDKIKSISIGGQDSYAIVGPAYFSKSFSAKFKEYISDCYNRPGTNDYYWENVLIEQLDSLPIYMNKQTGNVREFENLEELRQFDPSYKINSNNKIMALISKVYHVPELEIKDIQPIKVGMTNRSFLFSHDNRRYIMRIPGEGTDKLIDRKNEHTVYQAIEHLNLCDEVKYSDPEAGYKITVFWDNSRVCDPLDMSDVKECMKKLREFHEMKLQVPHKFDVFERINFYESMWLEADSCFRDYKETKANVMKLQDYINSVPKELVLAHIDAVPDNFIFIKKGDESQLRLIDWEYAGMQDPHIDIAMFAVYSLYGEEQVNMLIDCYFIHKCPHNIRVKIYAYIAVCGLLWSNWCEYKRHLGVEFGEYALKQYRYAKDFYRIFNENV